MASKWLKAGSVSIGSTRPTQSAAYEEVKPGRQADAATKYDMVIGGPPKMASAESSYVAPSGPRKVMRWGNMFRRGKPMMTETFTCEVLPCDEEEIPPRYIDGKPNLKYIYYLNMLEARPFSEKYPCWTIVILTLSVLGYLLICGGVATGVAFLYRPPTRPPSTTPTPPTTPLPPLVVTYTRSFYDAVCEPYFANMTGQRMNATDLQKYLKKCGMGSPPAIDTCSGGGTCTFYSYGASYGFDQNRKWKNWTFTNKAQIYHPSAQLVSKGDMVRCQTDTGKIGVCDGNKCRETDLEEEQTTHTNSKWEDNCDKPNPCWQGEPMDQFDKNAPTTREQCLQKDTEHCAKFSYISVVPWMQHLRCKSGKNSTATTACAGIPLKLWVCAKCPRNKTSADAYDAQCDPVFRYPSSCHFSCIQKDTTEQWLYWQIADGALCLDSRQNGTGYCYAGTCFRDFAALDETNKIPTKEECLQKRKEDE